MDRCLAIVTERRGPPRLSVELEARVFPGAASCVIVDLSAAGVRLRMDAPPEIGADVVVVEWSSGRAHDGQIVWTGANEAGVRLIRSCLLQDHPPIALAAVKAEWEARGSGDPDGL